MKKRKIMEWSALIMFLNFNFYLLKNASNLNGQSFSKISKIIYAVGESGGNVRANPTTNSNVKFTISSGDFVEFLKRDGQWFYVSHVRSQKEGWMHKVTMRRYLHLGYYTDYVVDKSLWELTWE